MNAGRRAEPARGKRAGPRAASAAEHRPQRVQSGGTIILIRTL
jgi:hypothetical protein